MPDEQPERIVVRIEPKKATEMIAEFLREIAALIFVFAPLDRYIAEDEVSQEWLTGTLLASIVLLLLGMALENVVESTEIEQ